MADFRHSAKAFETAFRARETMNKINSLLSSFTQKNQEQPENTNKETQTNKYERQ